MMRRILRHSILVAAIAMTGCGHSPSTTMLTLDAVAPPHGPVPAYHGPPIAIPAVHIPASLDHAEFVDEPSAGVAKLNDFAQWIAPMGILARDALIRDLMARLSAGAVLPPGSTGVASARTLDVTILSFAGGQDSGRLQAVWRVVPDGRVQPIDLTADGAGVGPVASAQLLSKLLGQLADAIANDLMKMPASPPARR